MLFLDQKRFYHELKRTLMFLLALVIMLPISARANSLFVITTNETGIPVLLGAILGSLAALFIRTEVDEKLYQPMFAKLVIGISLGILAPLTWEAHQSDMMANKLALPAFCIALFGTPICCFLITILCDPITWKIAFYYFLRRFGVDMPTNDELKAEIKLRDELKKQEEKKNV